MYIIWAVAIVLFAVLEGVTAQLVSIWFVLGAVAGLISAFCSAPVILQVVIFIAVTVIALIATRPLVKKFINTKPEKTNADRCIGSEAMVIEEINNFIPTGQVKINGAVWSARSADGAVIPKDTIVTVDKIEGVKLIVRTNNILINS